jgi:peptidylprolyl isomerase
VRTPAGPRTAATTLLVLAALVVAGCSDSVGKDDISSSEGTITGVTVAGAVGSVPTVRMAAPLRVPRTRTAVVTAGTGSPVVVDQLFVLQLTLYDARTGAKALSTYDEGVEPIVAKTSDDTLFPVLARFLPGQRQGSRLVLALTASDAYGSGGTPPPGIRPEDPVVAVADVVAVPPATVLDAPSGSPAPRNPGAPSVRYAGSQPVALDVGSVSVPAPAPVAVVPLVEGHGPAVRDHSLVTLDYLGQVRGRRVPFVSTYFQEPRVVAVGAEGSSATWDAALVGVRRGSRLLVVGPPGPADLVPGSGVGKNDVVAWVIDVLGVS